MPTCRSCPPPRGSSGISCQPCQPDSSRAMTNLENGEASLGVRLPPLLALRIPHLERYQTGAGHGEVRGVEDVAGFAVDVDGAVSEAEDLEHGELAAEQRQWNDRSHAVQSERMVGLPQIHGDQLCSAFLRTVSANVQKIPTADGSNLVSTSKATKNTTPGLAGLIPSSDRLVGQGAGRRVLLVKVVGSWRGLLQQLSAAVACNTVSAKKNLS